MRPPPFPPPLKIAAPSPPLPPASPVLESPHKHTNALGCVKVGPTLCPGLLSPCSLGGGALGGVCEGLLLVPPPQSCLCVINGAGLSCSPSVWGMGGGKGGCLRPGPTLPNPVTPPLKSLGWGGGVTPFVAPQAPTLPQPHRGPGRQTQVPGGVLGEHPPPHNPIGGCGTPPPPHLAL